MLKKLLPTLKSLPTLLQQKIQQLKSPKAQKPQEEKQLNQSPNLLNQYASEGYGIASTIDDFKSSPLKLIGYFQKLIVVIQLLFLIVISINYWQDSQIKSLSKELTLMDTLIRSYGPTVKNADVLIRRINRYKTLSTNRKLLSDRLSFVNANVGDVEINTLTINKDGIKITAEAKSPLSIALLIGNLFKNKDISAVILNSVTLDSAANIFYVNLDVAFK